MKTFPIACFLFTLAFLALPAWAQNPAVQSLGTGEESISAGELTPTPEMWFYQQYRQEYKNPAELVQNRAVFRAEQRERRVAAMKWFGFSAARPVASSDPWNSTYSPSWSSNNSFYPYRWSGYGSPTVIVNRSPSTTWTY